MPGTARPRTRRRPAIVGRSNPEGLEPRVVPTAMISYHGNGFFSGVIDHVEVSPIFWGSAWSTNPTLAADARSITGFYQMIVNSGYMDMLSDYQGYTKDRNGVYTYDTVGRGSSAGADVVLANNRGVSESETAIRSMITSEEQSGRVTRVDGNNLYVVYLPPGTTSAFAQQYDDANPGTVVGGYHYNFGIPTGPNTGTAASYAVIPYPSYEPSASQVLQAQTVFGSHELTEAVTNVRTAFGNYTEGFGTGWYVSDGGSANGDEVGDLCEGPNLKLGLYNGYWVQAEWSRTPVGPNEFRELPPGTTNIHQVGNGLGNFGVSNGGFSDSDPVEPLFPAESGATPAYQAIIGRTTTVPAASGVLAGFVDPSGLPLTAEVVSQPAGASVVVAPDGSFQYTPAPGEASTDSFQVEATDGDFTSDPVTIPVTVAPSAPVVTLSPSPTPAAARGTAVTLAGSTTNPGNTTLFVTVDYGDGSGPIGVPTTPRLDSDGQHDDFSLAHTYANSGTFTRTVTVSDASGNAVASTEAVTVAPVLPVITVSVPSPVAFGAIPSLTGTTTDPLGDPLVVTVDYGDGSATQVLSTIPDDPAGPGVLAFASNHAYAASGSYAITVVVRDSADPSAQAAITSALTIDPAPAPVVTLGVAATTRAGSGLTLSGSATDPGSYALALTVDYGDGSAPEALSTTAGPPTPDGPIVDFQLDHAYATPGTYTIRVSAANQAIAGVVGVGSASATVLPREADASDFFGDGHADLGVYGYGRYLIAEPGTTKRIDLPFGGPEDVPVVGDFFGDGRADLGVYGYGRFLIVEPGTNKVINRTLGGPEDVPAVGDFFGDGHDDLGVYGYGRFFILDPATGAVIDRTFGGPADVPAVGDFFGDGHADLGVYGYGRYSVDDPATGRTLSQPIGGPADVPVVGDYFGDGHDDFGVYGYGRYVAFDPSTRAAVDTPFGGPEDVPVVGDYFGDGTSDLGVYGYGRILFAEPGTTNFLSLPIGGPADEPVDEAPAALYARSTRLESARSTTRPAIEADASPSPPYGPVIAAPTASTPAGPLATPRPSAARRLDARPDPSARHRVAQVADSAHRARQARHPGSIAVRRAGSVD